MLQVRLEAPGSGRFIHRDRPTHLVVRITGSTGVPWTELYHNGDSIVEPTRANEFDVDEEGVYHVRVVDDAQEVESNEIALRPIDADAEPVRRRRRPVPAPVPVPASHRVSSWDTFAGSLVPWAVIGLLLLMGYLVYQRFKPVPAPVVTSAPVVVPAPAPVYIAPAPVVVAPAPVVDPIVVREGQPPVVGEITYNGATVSGATISQAQMDTAFAGGTGAYIPNNLGNARAGFVLDIGNDQFVVYRVLPGGGKQFGGIRNRDQLTAESESIKASF